MGDRKAPSRPPKLPRKPNVLQAMPRASEQREDQRPFARFLRAMSEGRVTSLRIEGTGILEATDGRKVAQMASVSVMAGSTHEEFKLETVFVPLFHIVPTLGLQMDRVDMLVPKPPEPLTTGQKIAATEGADA